MNRLNLERQEMVFSVPSDSGSLLGGLPDAVDPKALNLLCSKREAGRSIIIGLQDVPGGQFDGGGGSVSFSSAIG